MIRYWSQYRSIRIFLNQNQLADVEEAVIPSQSLLLSYNNTPKFDNEKDFKLERWAWRPKNFLVRHFDPGEITTAVTSKRNESENKYGWLSDDWHAIFQNLWWDTSNVPRAITYWQKRPSPVSFLLTIYFKTIHAHAFSWLAESFNTSIQLQFIHLLISHSLQVIRPYFLSLFLPLFLPYLAKEYAHVMLSLA